MKTPPLPSRLQDIDLRLLRIYKAVVDCGGFTAAEMELDIARSTISTHMAELESRLNLTLCKRGRSGFSLTEEGRAVYNATLMLLSSAEEFRTQVNSLQHAVLHGELKLAVTDNTITDPEFNLVDALQQFEQLAPEVYISISTLTPDEVERAVQEEKADIGVLPAHRNLPGFNYHKLYQEHSYLYCSDRHPLFHDQEEQITLAQVRSQKFIHAGLFLNEEVSNQCDDLNRAATAGHLEARATLILSGAYIGFLPNHFAQTWLDKGQLRRLLAEEKHYSSDAVAIIKKDRQPNRVVSTFLAKLKDIHYAPTTKD